MPECHYEPGTHNIGAKEITVRKKLLRYSITATLFFSILSGFYFQYLTVWAILFFSSFTLVVLYLEVKYGFCVLFGFFNLYNFGSPGELKDVIEIEHSKKDRRRVAKMMIQALIVSIAFTGMLRFLVMQYQF
jgi:hypothetical protein